MSEAPGRIALRIEGKWWVAYWARSMTSMDGAIGLARVRANLVERDPEIKQRFIEFAQFVMTRGLQAVGATVERWNDPVDAAEHEKSGRA
jgi:hypothetical protein